MNTIVKFFIATKLAFFLIVGTCFGADRSATELRAGLAEDTLKAINKDRHRFLTRALNQLKTTAPQGVATPENVSHYNNRQAAMARAATIGMVLKYDLDGDLAVDAREIKTLRVFTRRSALKRMNRLAEVVDVDGDGSLSISEIRDYATRLTEKRSASSRRINLLAFDRDGDGMVDAEELTKTVEAVAADAGEDSPTSRLNAERHPGCNLPEPSGSSQIVLAGAYEGEAIAGVLLGRRETYHASLNIEPGNRSLFVVLNTYQPIIWNVEGATDRIERILAPAGLAGFLNVESSKITYYDREACNIPVTYNLKDGKTIIARSYVSQLLDKNVDHIAGSYSAGTLSLPSGKNEETEPQANFGRDWKADLDIFSRTFVGRPLRETGLSKSQINGLRRLQSEMYRFSPKGVSAIEPNAVVADVAVKPYDVLPQQAGLLQLALESKITVTPDGFYLIRKPIKRFPAGLAGAHSVKFILGRGVPLPKGKPGHSSVYSEETGLCMEGFRCR